MKILVSLLLVLVLVVSVITFTMARLFHEDKRAYIHDLSSITALSAADESRSLLLGYSERLQAYARIVTNDRLTSETKGVLLREFVAGFPEIVSISLSDGDRVIEAAYDTTLLEQAGVTRQTVDSFRSDHPLPVGRIAEGEIFVQNSTVSPSMPTFTIALAPLRDAGRPGIVAAAVVKSDSLQRLVGRSKVLDVFVTDAEGTYLADADRGLVARRARAAPMAKSPGQLQSISASMTREYDLDGTTMVGGFSAVDVGGVMVGAQIPKSAAYFASRELLRSLVIVAFLLLVLATLISLLWARTITKPLERLSGATRTIAKGHFDIMVEEGSKDEIGTLAASFNQMAVELKHREEALQQAQDQLVQSEKMAAFGQLGAGIAHEVKNPLAGILGCAQLSLRKAEKGSAIEKNLELIEKETRRCKTIIENLLRFARQEKAAFSLVSVNSVVQDAAAIVNHQLEINQVKLEVIAGEGIAEIHGNANQLQQVLMNLMINAQQAMEGTPGSVTVRTRGLENRGAEIRVTDTGPGMPPEVKQRIFEPFFTTKPGGKGTGLGLSVSYGIIKDHRGEISVESEPGLGATFIITLPPRPSVPELEEREPARDAADLVLA
jgi:signal transduction histidine kinase